MSVIIFLAVLFVLILVHEWGHYITAKWTGMRVDEFGIGFPPKLFGWKKGETVYSLNALPIGGFVKILGENGEIEGGEVLSEADRARTFGARPKWAQALVLIAGVTMNTVFAWLLLIAILVMGTTVQVGEDTATAAARLTVLATLPDSPASVIPTQAEIISVSNADTTLTDLTPSAFSDFVATTNGNPLTIQYQTNDQDAVTTVDLTPTSGLDASDSSRLIVGVSLGLLEDRTYELIPAVKEATLQTIMMLKAITIGLVDLLKGAVMGTADLSQVAGPVGIVSHVGDAAAVGLSSLFYLTAIISLNLAVINLFPIPALDGGRLIFVAIEALTRKTINPIWSARVNMAGMALLLLLMVAVTYNDILKLL